MQELIMTLEKENEIYTKLIPIQEKKKKVIIINDVKTLQEITHYEQEVIQQIGALERKRQEIITNMGMVLNRAPETLDIPALIKILDKQPEEKKRLSIVYDSLKQTVHRLVDINALNQTLIEESLEMIEFNMNLIQSTRMSPGNNYNKDAMGINMPMGQAGIFDARQ